MKYFSSFEKKEAFKKAIILSITGNKKSCSNIVCVELDTTITKSMPDFMTDYADLS